MLTLRLIKSSSLVHEMISPSERHSNTETSKNSDNVYQCRFINFARMTSHLRMSSIIRLWAERSSWSQQRTTSSVSRNNFDFTSTLFLNNVRRRKAINLRLAEIPFSILSEEINPEFFFVIRNLPDIHLFLYPFPCTFLMCGTPCAA